jgi:hypothetical protein
MKIWEEARECRTRKKRIGKGFWRYGVGYVEERKSGSCRGDVADGGQAVSL